MAYPPGLEPIETASVDELQALQRDRLRSSLRRAYEHVPHYRAAFDAAGVHPEDVRDLTDLRHLPFTTKAHLRDSYPFGMLAVPREQLARVHASSGTTGRPTVVGYTAADLDTWASLMARSIRAAGGRPGRPAPQRLRLRPVHRRPRRARRRGAARLHGRPGLRRHDRAPGAADRRPRAADHHGHPVVPARDRGRDGPPGHRPAVHRPGGRDPRRRAVDRPDAPGDRGACSASTRSTSTGSPR